MSKCKIEMRVIAGTYRHRLLAWPNDNSIRPTKDRIREAIFSALGDISNLSFLDLYAGSGAMGIEAISRGVAISYFVDISKEALRTIKANVKSLNIPVNQYQIFEDYDENVLDTFIKDKKQVDIVFLDPPYKQGRYEEIINKIIDNNLLALNGVIVCESDKEIDVEIECKKTKLYKYGEIFVKIFWR